MEEKLMPEKEKPIRFNNDIEFEDATSTVFQFLLKLMRANNTFSINFLF